MKAIRRDPRRERPANPVAEAIRSFRKREQLLQEVLAASLGCPRHSLSQYENGVMHPSPARLLRLLSIMIGAEERTTIIECLRKDGISVRIGVPEDPGAIILTPTDANPPVVAGVAG